MAVAAVLLALGLAACDQGTDERDDERGSDMDATIDGLVCGLVDEQLVRRVVGEDDIGTVGRGIETNPQWEPFHCQVQNATRHRTVMQLTIGLVDDPDTTRRQLEAEAERTPGCTRYDGYPGVGYGCIYGPGGRFAQGAGVNVVTGDRLIRVIVKNWPDQPGKVRLALAVEIARDLDRNVTAYLATQAS